MGTGENKLVLLYRELLEIAGKEQSEIAGHNFEKIEHYCSLKEDVVKKLEGLDESEKQVSSPEEQAEIESLIKKIIAINNANVESVRDMKNRVVSELNDLNSKKTAVRAYNSVSEF
jgi:hypothetical protein